MGLRPLEGRGPPPARASAQFVTRLCLTPSSVWGASGASPNACRPPVPGPRPPTPAAVPTFMASHDRRPTAPRASRRRAAGACAALLCAAAAPPAAGAQERPSVPHPFALDSVPARGAHRDSVRADSARRGRADAAVADSSARVERPGVRVCAGGDVTLGTNVDTTWTRHFARKYKVRAPALPNPNTLLAPLRPLFAGADIVLLNVEGAIGRGRAPSKCGPRSTACFALRQPTAAARALRRVAASAEVVGNVANNHARDAGPAGFDTTRARLAAAGVHVTGADTLATTVVTAAGDTVAFLGFSTSAEPDARDLEAVRRHVARAAERYRRVVVTAHIGAEGVRAQRTRDTVEQYFGASRGNPVAFAHVAVEAGASLVVGHGPHVLRAAEWRDDALVLYSLGNLVTYGPFSFTEPITRGAVACATLDDDGRVANAELRATRQRRPGRVSADRTERAFALVDSLSRLDFPATGARVSRDGALRRAPDDSARREGALAGPRR